jgi:hypothetical protein
MEDNELIIKKAGLTGDRKLCAGAVLAAFQFLKAKAIELKIPIEQITPDHLMSGWIADEMQYQENQKRFGNRQ